jgi:hypothetical protein
MRVASELKKLPAGSLKVDRLGVDPALEGEDLIGADHDISGILA